MRSALDWRDGGGLLFGGPAAQQNALVQRYCAVCHTDAAKNGGLSLEHFDAAGRRRV
jgi:hypothetical protein